MRLCVADIKQFEVIYSKQNVTYNRMSIFLIHNLFRIVLNVLKVFLVYRGVYANGWSWRGEGSVNNGAMSTSLGVTAP